jgi:flagellar basal-body rod modification protein FlgD
MTQILPTAAAAPLAGSAAGRPEAKSGNTRALASDFETFLRMLTTQLRNQDPLNPMQSTDFAVQLATFSTVEQGVRTNQLLEGMMNRTALAELAGLVGMSVRSEGPAQFDGTALTLGLPALSGVESTRLVVRDALGETVDSAEVPATGGPHVWRGLGADGMALPAGSYSFQLVGYVDGQPVDSAAVETFAQVVEARQDSDGTRLVLVGGREVALEAVSGLRSPGIR